MSYINTVDETSFRGSRIFRKDNIILKASYCNPRGLLRGKEDLSRN